MRKHWKLTMALGVLIALSVAAIASGAAKPNQASTVVVGNLKLTFNGGFTPTVLPKKTLAPIALSAEGTIASTDGTHIPALTEAIIETDKNGAINVKGYPKCTAGKLQSQDSSHAKAICKSSLVGTGKTTAEVEFPESKPILVNSELLVFNGGEKAGVTTLFIHAYFSAPVTGAIVTTVKIKKIHNGRYGLLSTATIPKIAGGSGSVKSFSLKIDKKFTYKGKKVSILSAKCPDGKLQAHVKANFKNYKTSENITASTEILRTCTGKG
jgi:hypothetical protein